MKKIKYKDYYQNLTESPQADKLFRLKKSYEELSKQYADAQKRGRAAVADNLYKRMDKTLDAIEKLEKK